MARKKSQQPFKVVHPHCAGIDVGSREHWVGIDPSHPQPVNRFSTFTDDLFKIADWLEAHDVTVVAMEATGIYWIPLFEVLDGRGFEVFLVNSRSTRQVSGRKSDALDCQWIWQLMHHGMLKAAFRPADPVCCVRSLVRQRATRVRDQSQTLNRIQKVLFQMNIQLANVISDIAGITGMKILRAIIAGERNPQRLAELRHGRVKANSDTIARSLHGNWRLEHLHALKQEVDCYDFLNRMIEECDQAIGDALELLPVLEAAPQPAKKVLRSPHRSAAAQSSLHQALWRIMGVDLTAIPTLGVDTVLVLASEIGPDLSRFPSCEHFCSWLGLAPPTRISGGRQLPGRGPKVINRAGQALRQAASNARNEKGFIGANHRARLVRMDTSCAIKATAHQLARLIYAMLTQGQEYIEKGIEAFEERSQERQHRALLSKARKMGYELQKIA